MRKKYLLTVLVLLVSVICFAGMLLQNSTQRYGNYVDGENYRRIQENELLEIQEKEHPVYLLDVREREELSDGMIPGAVHVPLSNFTESIERLNLQKQDIVIVYCASGVRSATAARQLCSLGYLEIYDFGGIGNYSGTLCSF